VPSFYSRTGDDGFTRLLGPERAAKYDPRPEAYGAVDEASAALGLARSLAKDRQTGPLLVEVQRDLYHLMAELAATAGNAERLRRITPERIAWLESEIDRLGAQTDLPGGFILSGDTPAGAALDLARTIVRRAERRVARLLHSGEIDNPDLLRYLNRLSSLCFVLILRENRAEGVERPTMAKG
jgi:cob(I)alamin adenosyltransferase